MKIVQLGEVIKGFDGKEIMLNERFLTFRDIFLQQLGSYSSQDGKELIQACSIGQKIYDHKGPEIELEDAEFNLLKKSLDKTVYTAIVMGAIHKSLE